MAKKKFAVLCSGGDGPGMNSAIRSVVRTAVASDAAASPGLAALSWEGPQVPQGRWQEVAAPSYLTMSRKHHYIIL